MTDERLNYRVVYVGTGRQRTRRLLGVIPVYEPEREWRQRVAQEMEDACQEMARRGLRLIQVVPVLSSVSLQGGWTEGAWLCFESEPDRDA
jgi:hypothetical protein